MNSIEIENYTLSLTLKHIVVGKAYRNVLDYLLIEVEVKILNEDLLVVIFITINLQTIQ